MIIFHSGVHRNLQPGSVTRTVARGPVFSILSAYDWFRENGGPDRGFKIICRFRKRAKAKESKQ